MGATLAQLVPMILGAVLAPIWLIVILLMLASPGGLAKASAFVLGTTATRLAQGAIFGTLLAASPDAGADGDGGKSTFVATLLLVVGILLLIAAYHKWRKEADPDEPPPKWMQSIDQMTPLKAFGMGAMVMGVGIKMWVFTLSALGVIRAEELGMGPSIVAYLIYVVLAQILLIAAIALSAAAPGVAGPLLGRANSWLARNNRPISITVALIFGIYFAWDGASSLLR